MGISIESSSPEADSTGTDGDTEDNYVFNIDLTSVSSYTLTGDFDSVSNPGRESDFSHTYAGAAGSFTINGDGTFTYTISKVDAIAQSMSQEVFTVTGTDDNSGAPIVDTDTITFNFTLCFAKGTRIATPAGERAIEDLGVGDPVLTADGRCVPVRWIGRTTIHPMFNPADRLDPVRIAKDAFGPDTPNCDLIVTADHGMILDDLVINASALVNGSSIDWHPWKQIGQSLTWYHVETEAHDVILANNAPAETFLDMPDRRSFENFAEYTALYGDETNVSEMNRHRITAQRLLPTALRQKLGISPEKNFASGK